MVAVSQWRCALALTLRPVEALAPFGAGARSRRRSHPEARSSSRRSHSSALHVTCRTRGSSFAPVGIRCCCTRGRRRVLPSAQVLAPVGARTRWRRFRPVGARSRACSLPPWAFSRVDFPPADVRCDEMKCHSDGISLALPYGGSRIHFRHRLRHGLCVVGSCSRFRSDTQAGRDIATREGSRATMNWVRARIANRSKFLQRCNGSDRGFVTGLAPVWYSYYSLGDERLP